MIIIKLLGGLGNQMFQYALGRHLALLNKTTLKLDLTGLEDRYPWGNFVRREYQLDIFRHAGQIAEPAEVKNFSSRDPWIRLLKQGIGRLAGKYIKEPHFHFFRDVLNFRGEFYVDGYWQSEKYFKDIEEIIRKDFTFTAGIKPQSDAIQSQIINCNAVGVHVRRGDFVVNPLHGLCTQDFFSKAAQMMIARTNAPHFFVFSDDVAWCEKNLELPRPVTFVDNSHEGKNGSNHFKLLTACKHFIISNSSFSWWAAWLAVNKDKVIIAPQQWFKDSRKYDLRDILPENWIKL